MSTIERKPIDGLLALLLPAITIAYVVIAPYTKVEESFNIQAIHDILRSGIPVSGISTSFNENYDHFKFPGSVPRTFVGALALSAVTWPFSLFLKGLHRQMLVRIILGLFNSFCLLSYRNAVRKSFGRSTANWFVVFQTCQFNILFWMSRTIPNSFAFGLCTIALSKLLPNPSLSPSARRQQQIQAYTIMAFSAAILRAEIVVLMAMQGLWKALTSPSIFIPIQDLINGTVKGGAIGVLTSVMVDSFFWQRFPIWPEFVGFVYNVIGGQSSAWGVSVWHYYFSFAIPKMLFNPAVTVFCLPFAIIQPVLRSRVAGLIIPNLIFVAIYSILPHKEWRFIEYIVPSLTTAAAISADWMWQRRSRILFYRLASLILAASVPVSVLAGMGLSAISSLNYPGADALNRLYLLEADDTHRFVVHMDTLSCMTGITRFLQVSTVDLDSPGSRNYTKNRFIYDKTEDPETLLDFYFWARFDYALMESPDLAVGAWDVLDTVDAYSGIKLVKPSETLKSPADKDYARGRKRVEKDFMRRVVETWNFEISKVGRKFTKGWWIIIDMQPKISILQRL